MVRLRVTSRTSTYAYGAKVDVVAIWVAPLDCFVTRRGVRYMQPYDLVM
jgi:hypothetical protein